MKTIQDDQMNAEIASNSELGKDEIAQLSSTDICKLRWDQMVSVVQTSEAPINPRVRFDTIEGDTLVRLVYFARQHCRNLGF